MIGDRVCETCLYNSNGQLLRFWLEKRLAQISFPTEKSTRYPKAPSISTPYNLHEGWVCGIFPYEVLGSGPLST